MVVQLLKNIMQDYILFVDYKDELLNEIDNVNTCLTSKNCDTAYCLKTEEKICKLLIPKTNLINKLNNEEFYFAKLADELIRYSRLRDFLFNANSFLSFSNVPYKINEDEIILLQSLLTQDFFDNLNPVQLNKYISTNTYDTAQPFTKQRYTENIVKQKKEIACSSVIESNITKKWRKYFTEDFKEIIFEETVECGYMVISRLVESFTGEKLDINDIKNTSIPIQSL